MADLRFWRGHATAVLVGLVFTTIPWTAFAAEGSANTAAEFQRRSLTGEDTANASANSSNAPPGPELQEQKGKVRRAPLQAAPAAEGKGAGADAPAEKLKSSNQNKQKPMPQKPSARQKEAVGKKENSREKEKASQKESASQKASLWFPDWPPAEFDWYVRPVLGARLERDNETKTTTSSFEVGVGAGLLGVPLKPGNPGASLAPRAGYSIGNTTVTTDSANARTGLYHRVSAGLALPVYVKFTKTTLDINYAQILGKLVATRRSAELSVDEGLLLRLFETNNTLISTHYTLSLLRSYAVHWQAPLLESNDHWLSLRLSTSLLSARVAMGPGVTFAKHYYLESDSSKSSEYLGATRTSYLKLLGSMDLFWKLGLSLDAKYIIDASATNATTANTQLRLPSQDLNSSPLFSLYPSDSAIVSAFFGLKNLIGGLGLGYRYTVEWISIGGKNGAKSEKKESSGLGLFFQY